jgi:hypothetical protein
MKEPERIPLDPNRPRTHKPKTYRLPPLYPETMTQDIYRPDSDSVYVPIQSPSTIRYQIHDDFFVESNNPDILKHYEKD